MNKILIVFILLGLFGASASAALTDGLVALLHMDNDWNDSSGNGNNGTATGATFTTSAKLGSHAGSFDGSSYITTPLATSSTTTTLFAWVNLETTSEYGTFIQAGNENGIGFCVGDGSTCTGNGNTLMMHMPQIAWVSTGTPIGTGWHQIAVTASAGDYNFYLDGGNVYSVHGSELPPTTYTNIGAFNSTGGNGLTLTGGNLMDEVAIWNRVLTTDEITELYNAGDGEEVPEFFGIHFEWIDLSSGLIAAMLAIGLPMFLFKRKK